MATNYEPICRKCRKTYVPDPDIKKQSVCSECDDRGKKAKILLCIHQGREPKFDLKDKVGIWLKPRFTLCNKFSEDDPKNCDIKRMKDCFYYQNK